VLKLSVKLCAALAVAGAALLGPSGDARADKAFPYVFITEASNGSDLAIIDTGSNTVVAKIPVASSISFFPTAGAVTSDGKTVYLSNSDSSVSVVDVATQAVVSSIRIGVLGNFLGPSGVAISPDGSDVYVTDGVGDLVDIATSTNTVVKTIPLTVLQGRGGAGVAIAPDGSKIYVAQPSTNSVAVIGRNGNSVETTITVGASPTELAITPDGSKLYVENMSTVSVISTRSNTVTKTIVTPTPVQGYGGGIAVSPDGSRVYAGAGGPSPVISVIATGSDSIVDSIPTGIGPITLTPDGAHLYVASNSRVLLVDAASGATVSSITGAAPGVGYVLPAIFAGGFRSNSTLQITTSNTGTGTVSSDPSGIACSGACSHSFGTGSVITLTATAAPGSVFAGWTGGGCVGTSDCKLTLRDDTAVTAIFVPRPSATYALTVSPAGSGTVRTMPSGLACASVCTASYAAASSVTLTASPAAGSIFTGWSGGGCSGTGACTVSLSADTMVTANFAPLIAPVALSATVIGDNSASSIFSSPGGIRCSTQSSSGCDAAFQPGTVVTLFATNSFARMFTGWSGDCSGTAPCTITLSRDAKIAASFSQVTPMANLRLQSAGSGTGSISSNPSGAYCHTACGDDFSFPIGTTVTLTPVADPGSSFTGWSGGGCSGTSPCTLTINADTTVTGTFTFTASNATLSISQSGYGAGFITSSPVSITCTAACSTSFPFGATVTLTATPAAGSVFAGWSGTCGGSPQCTVTMNGNQAVTASFYAPLFDDTLSVSLAGTGAGTVTSSPAGIACGSACSASFADGTTVLLSLTPAHGSILTGVTGTFCTVPTSICIVNLYGDTPVTATFQPASTLTVMNTGPATGSVSVSGNPCFSTCSTQFATGSQVTLTAPSSPGGPTFMGWSGGGCSGTGSCTVTLNGDVTVSANFAFVYSTVSVSLAGAGTGTVVSNPSGLSCGSACSASFVNTASVLLSATPTNGSVFLGWSGGGCSLFSIFCSVTPSTDTSVTATFGPPGSSPPMPPPNERLSASASGAAGSITINPGAISCSICSLLYPQGTVVTLSATPSSGNIFTGWSGDCTGLTCSVALMTDMSVLANFAVARTVSVVKSGTGAGVVTSNPGGITCGPTCSAVFADGGPLTLSAAAAQGSVFAGWSGAGCSGTGACIVTPTADVTVTAMFTLLPTTAMLSVAKTGSGTVNSAPSGIACGPTCNASFDIGAKIALTATADAGSTFVGWSGGNCSGNQRCNVTLAADAAVTANFVANSATSIALVSAILPSSRSVQVGSTATLFGTMINAGPGTATFCGVAPATSMPGSFYFQTTDPATNGLTGTANTPVDIPQGAAQSFLLAFTPSAAFNPTDVAFTFSCANANAAASFEGVNTLMLSASTAPIPDIVSIAGTLTSDGQLHLAGAADTGAFVVAIANVGAAGQITATADTGGANLPVSISICQTNQATGACLQPPATTVPAAVGSNSTASFGIFVKATGAIPFMPAVNRAFVRFLDGTGTVRGSTSVAVRTQ
jgi:YVTN family beta-propeller protein